jgi:hypothetical protein
MNHKELVDLAALLEISDDYEEPVHIHHRVAKRLGICGVVVAPDEIRGALIDLLGSGLAKAYWLGGPGPVEELSGLPALDRFQDYYFWITDEGKRALAVRRRQWPLDEEDEILPGWSPPSE